MKFYVFNASSDKVSVNCSLCIGLLNTEHKPLVKKKRSTGRRTVGDIAFKLSDPGTEPVTSRDNSDVLTYAGQIMPLMNTPVLAKQLLMKIVYFI